MAEFETRANGASRAGDLSDELVQRVGAAAAKVALIQDTYSATVQTEASSEARSVLAIQARREAAQAIDEPGLTVDDYNTVLNAAEGDPGLERRLVDAARRSL